MPDLRDPGVRLDIVGRSQDESLGELLTRLKDDARTLIHAEIELYKTMALARVAGLKVAAALGVAGLLLFIASLTALLVGLAIALGQAIGALGGALVVGLGGVVLSGLLFWIAARSVGAKP